MPARLLVIGFGPFPGMRRNPSGEAALRLAALPRWRLAGVEARAMVLATTYRSLTEDLAGALAEGADAVLMIGVAGRSRHLRVETRARNRASILSPDAAGQRPPRLAFGPGPGARISRAAVAEAVTLLRRSGLPARLSADAGRYLCNAGYYAALAAEPATLFVHIPKPPRRQRCRNGAAGKAVAKPRRPWPETLARSLAAVASAMLRRAGRPAR